MPENKTAAQQPLNQKMDTMAIGWRRLLSYKWVVKNIPFFLFLSVLAVLYIYNGHFSDRIEKKISTAEKHIKELEYEYKTVKSEVIYRSKASELAKAVEPMGLKELIKPPMVIAGGKKINDKK